MSDLIDFDSPTCNPVSIKLLSPLIPAPSNIECNNVSVSNDKNTLTVNRRESIINNPFDMVLHQALENVWKKEDPFEIVLEKAIEKDESIVMDNENTNITDDLKATYTQKLKEDKTLNESFVKSTIEVHSMNTSILNQSAMNNTFSENCNTEECEINSMVQQKVPVYTQTVENNVYNTSISKKSLSHKYLLSRSQEDMRQVYKQCLKPRSNSIVETLKTEKASNSDSDSLFSIDSLNKGFLQSQYSNNSVFSTLSNISNITRVTPTSLAYDSEFSAISNNTMNCGFLNSCSADVLCDTRLNGSVSDTMNIVSVNFETSSSLISTQKQIDISALIQKLNDVKMTLSKSQVSHTESTGCDYQLEQGLNNTFPCLKDTSTKTVSTDNKLLDIDTYIPEIVISKHNSNGSSNSISCENSKLNNLIIDEAKVLSRTFEELAHRVSGSSLGDFNINDVSWPSDLVPAFEDEMYDLIPPSLPDVNKDTVVNDGSDDILSQKINIKDDKTATSTLLLDLKKVVKAENNSEANTLLENLEKVLGFQSNKNMKLLSTNPQASNSTSKNCEDDGTRLEIIKNIENERYINKSYMDDSKIHKIEINQNLCLDDKMNNKVKDEAFNGSKNLPIIESEEKNNQLLENKCAETSLKEEKNSIRIGKKENVDIIPSSHIYLNENEKANNETEDNEKIAVELLINLGKVLSGQSEKSATLNLLKNLGEVLNLTLKNKEDKSDEQDDPSCTNYKCTAIETKLKTGKKVQPLMSPKLKHRKSLDVLSKVGTSNEKMFRKSIYATGTARNETPQNKSANKNNSSSLLRRTSKRFPSDPGSLNLASRKSKVAASMEDIRQSDETKDISVNIKTHNQTGKASIKLAVKNQLKSKPKSEVVNKKGPMKAVIAIGNMQRKSIIVSPKSPKNVFTKIRNSTPNSADRGPALKNSRSKPIASSTPDTPKRKSLLQLPVLQRSNKLNISCDISPINALEETTADKCGVYISKKTNGCPSPRKVTSDNPVKESSIPKYSTSPGVRVRLSSSDMNKSGQSLETSRISFKRENSISIKSPVNHKRIGASQPKSPLKDSNKNFNKTKPLNLSSTFRRKDNIGSDKENAVL